MNRDGSPEATPAPFASVSICGQLAGAVWRESEISESLRSGLARMDMIEGALEGIVGG